MTGSSPPASVVTLQPLLQRLENSELVESDVNKVGDYVKRVLFEAVVFIWDKKSLAVGGKLHADYLENCRALVADGKLENVSNESAKTYLNLLWNMMTKDECYKKWMSTRRSNTYQAMEHQFMSK